MRVTYPDGSVQVTGAWPHRFYLAITGGAGAAPRIRFYTMPSGILQYKHIRDRKVWGRAVSLLDAGAPRDPLVLYIVHEQREDHGVPARVAVRVRRENEP